MSLHDCKVGYIRLSTTNNLTLLLHFSAANTIHQSALKRFPPVVKYRFLRLSFIVNSSRAGIFRLICRFNGKRSEEHTSELQSRGHLVCRLLLAKKKRPIGGHEPTHG